MTTTTEDQPSNSMQQALSDTARNDLLADLATKDCLAEVLCRQGKRAEGEALLRDALEQRKTTLGQTAADPDMRRTMNNLAGTLEDQHEATTLFRQVFEADKAELGLDHEYTILSQNNVAQVLSHQGKHEEAEDMMRQVVALSQTVHGPYHRETVDLTDNLREILRARGKTDEAQKMLDERPKLHQTMAEKRNEDDTQEKSSRKALAESQTDGERVSGMRNLADVLEKKGQYEEAGSVLRSSIELAEGLPDGSKEGLRSSKRCLGVLLSRQHKYKEAEEVFRGLLDTPGN